MSSPNPRRISEWNYAAAASGIANTTTAVTIKAAVAAMRNYITRIQIAHDALTTGGEFVIRDGAAGTVLFRTPLQTTAQELRDIAFDPPLRGTAGTLLEVATLTASGAGGVYVNVQGFTGT